MALKNQSLFLFGYTVDVSNQYIDFRIVPAGPILTAVLRQGNFSLTDLLLNIGAALSTQDPTHTYTVVADRTVNGGKENRISISTDGTHLELLFGSGPHVAASAAFTIGFLSSDYTGTTHYNGSFTTGVALMPVYTGYNWNAPTRNRKLFGSVNVSAAGVKQAIVFQLQQFFSVEFKFEPELTVDRLWQVFLDWAAQQQDLEFTPEITSPEIFYNCTLESTPEEGQGLGWMMKEMLPEFPGLYETGKLEFRINLVTQQFLTGV